MVSIPFPLIIIFLWMYCLKDGVALIQVESLNNNLVTLKDYQTPDQVRIPKVSLTQKGYIQFLKYVVNVPEINDYTFCIWMKSFNLTYNHPLLSYSKHEHDRLIRVWITPQGTHVNLELLEVPVFSVPVHVEEHKWYHICQSWFSQHGAWSLYMDGKLKARGHQPKLRQAIIPAHGDIVVGQEYTDFDKGLDDGIEGSISGFNLVLSSAFHYAPEPSLANGIIMEPDQLQMKLNRFSKRRLSFTNVDNAPRDLGYSGYFPNRPRNTLHKSLGLLLVELSHDCSYLRGAPLSGKDVLVSWTKTVVRVFGGAILKTVAPFCPKAVL